MSTRERPSASLAVFLTSAAAVALLTWLTLAAAGRLLGASSFASFSGIWSLFYAVAGALYGYQQELTRATAAAVRDPHFLPRSGPRLGSVAMVCTLVTPSVLLALSPAWSPGVAPTDTVVVVVVLVLGVAGQVTYSTFNGILAGAGRWGPLAGVILVEAMTKLVMTVAVSGRDPSHGLMAVVVVAGTLTWPLMLAAGRARAALTRSWRLRMERPLSRITLGVTTSGCSALLVAGFPFLLVATQPRADTRVIGSVVAAVSLGRAPLLVMAAPLTAVLMRRLATHALPRRGLLAGVALFAVTVPIGAAAAAFIGPTIVRLVFGPTFVVGPGVMVWTVVSAALLLAHMVSGTALIASSHHLWSALGWALAVVVTVAVLFVPSDPEQAASAALVLGPLAGLSLHIVALTRR